LQTAITMSVSEPKEAKTPPKPPSRKLKPEEDRQEQERSRADPLADEDPSICRGTD